MSNLSTSSSSFGEGQTTSAIIGQLPVSTAGESNPFGMKLIISDLGIDPLGYWRCYSGPNNIDDNPTCYRPSAQSMYNFYGNEPAYGFKGPVYAAIDMEYPSAGMQVRASIAESAATCEGGYVVPSGLHNTTLDGLYRFVLYNSRVAIFSAWVCGLPDGLPRNVSVLNLTHELAIIGLPPLEPGPLMTFELFFTEPLSFVHQALLQEEVCTVIWDKVDDNCVWRIWTSMYSKMIGNKTIWTLAGLSIYKSNSNAGRANYLVTKLLNSDSFRSEFQPIDQIYLSTISSPSSVLDRKSFFGCATHYDCEPGLFCSLSALNVYTSSYRGGGAACDLCQYCISDDIDPIDKWCPRDKCGLTTGGYPSCINATKLFHNFSCNDSYKIDLRLSPDYSIKVLSVPNLNVNSKESGSTPSLIKARFFTPFNQIIGGIVITQRRVNGTCSYENDLIGKYYMMKNPAEGQICRGNNVDSRPFGYDPAFLSSSPIYDGTLDEAQYYKTSSLRINTLSKQSVPFGFFPHNLDPLNMSHKAANITMQGDAYNFKLYFDERLSGVQAQRLLNYMISGAFLDGETDTVTVEAITVNADYNIFALVSFSFTWQVIVCWET